MALRDRIETLEAVAVVARRVVDHHSTATDCLECGAGLLLPGDEHRPDCTIGNLRAALAALDECAGPAPEQP